MIKAGNQLLEVLYCLRDRRKHVLLIAIPTLINLDIIRNQYEPQIPCGYLRSPGRRPEIILTYRVHALWISGQSLAWHQQLLQFSLFGPTTLLLCTLKSQCCDPIHRFTMFDTICTLPLSSDLFAQALHPTLPILSVGLSAGHVQAYQLPPAPTSADPYSDSEDDDANHIEDPKSIRRCRSSIASESGLGEIETAWRTRRHKGSCRCLTFSADGEVLYSAGTDGLLKAARTETGQVCSKVAVPEDDGYKTPLRGQCRAGANHLRTGKMIRPLSSTP